ncbi:Xylulose-5-phosphate phosphoketolase [Metamycoplasma arthritidis]|uniref:Phosphoketolase ''D-xylulose 5-phosphate/D-fructose 6-phosphate phosphoketolase n=1 Tax=Metamycoplasma arthritidis (strain 158L3-1) TaxID=243272 RepID=B3PMQ0_META1|nr:phosphoketolase family protein [Metamycoplasma arthritidis]ACF07302.1 phosphoketolase ''D-xylulose 5-phosphate/D-fructose 6-phosphate phosphoketolase [Metamycoplasma arthritidis 158L3-1]VEU78823.1 Xylulose-5-phosphate phosphoketolase [Metamycoplasma arthritidis]
MKKTNYDSNEYFNLIDKWFRAANYLSVGQIYLRNNPLLKTKLVADDVKIYPIGHWGTIPGQNFIYAHLNRVINKYDLEMFYIEGPGHGGQVMISNSYLDGSYTEIYPEITEDEAGLKTMFKRFSFPGGTASHAAPETPGSIHEGGELGYALSHATGAILDNPNVIAATVIGDGEAETGPLAAGWFSNSFINPVNDGAVLPIIHLNGAKISNPTILSRKSNQELENYFSGLGWEPLFVEGDDPKLMHPLMAKKLDEAIEKIQMIQASARKHKASEATRPVWPMLIVRTPKGWTGPKDWNGEVVEGSFRAHQVPIPVNALNMTHIDKLEAWLTSYHPEELFDKNGKILEEIRALAPKGLKRMAVHPITNGGINPRTLKLSSWEKFATKFETPGQIKGQDMIELGKYFAEIITLNKDNFRIFGPDETKSNRMNAVFNVTKRQWLEKIAPTYDEWMSPEGRVIDSQLSEHQAEGFLEGYVITGRHGVFASYEAFLRVVDSMLTQHMKWMKKSLELPWRKDFPSLNVIATSTAFQQDHNGYTHQDPGLLGHLADKRPELIREYLPADTNCLLATMEKALKDRNVINLIVASKQPREQFYSVEEASELVQKGYKIINWASNVSKNEEPDVVFAAAGVEPNLEALAAISILNKEFPNLKIRFVNVLDLLKLKSPKHDPRGISDEEFDQIFTKNKPIIFAFHGYEGLLRDIFFDRHNHNLITHGYRENGDITTSFDIRQLSHMDRFHIAKDAAIAALGKDGEMFAKKMDSKLQEHTSYVREYGYDLPEVVNWKWTNLKPIK